MAGSLLAGLTLVVALAALWLNNRTTIPQGKAVSLLFENDADWEHFADRASALLFHEPATSSEAAKICKQNNEKLLDIKNLPDISSQFSYFQFQGEIDKNERYWVDSDGKTCSTAPLSSQVSCVDSSGDVKLPFLCTNSALHTDKVDVDFRNSPKIDVASNGTVFTGTRDHMAFRFMGIPYAEPPTGPLRFKYAQAWRGEKVDATTLKPGCLQWGFFENNNLGVNPWGTSEDCLYLNVYTPHLPSQPPVEKSPALKPVLFWIHGGGNFYGLGTDLTFDGGPLASRTDSVIVTINYRLNIFGFLGLNDEVITGNYALTDKITALRWVKDNIAAFGGDPENVTIFGQSAGGWSVIDLLRSPPAKGLFHRAISQSGGASTYSTAEKAASIGSQFVAPFCNGTGIERLECLQAVPAEHLLNAARSLPFWPSVQDGIYIVDSAMHQIEEGSQAINSVPFMVGFVPDEGQSALQSDIGPEETDFNTGLIKELGPDLAKIVQGSGLWQINEGFTPYNATANVFGNLVLTCPAEQMVATAAKSGAFPALYVYTMRRGYALSFFNPHGLCSFPVGKPQPYYICHSSDLYEVFGTYHIFSQPVRVKEDIYYTALVQDMWGAFARTGNPNPDLAYLKARGRAYESSLKVLSEGGWTWPPYAGSVEGKEGFGSDGKQKPLRTDGKEKGQGEGKVASLNYPGLGFEDGMPDEKNGRCAVLIPLGFGL
ncbi:hypothetical protein V5O48_000259 [Marasmius crinis-equi]|uniref:Carboxylesterase type B domain-containing protein n=1 Tax=Marasmius crinis-equi TaxID=585013 RepID=A0ABR3G1Q8_9AGAR